ncbi:MAG: hypothetical protein U9N10_02950, partial [Bacillota bacterium]|nr:hypothetical protein [Bacillota bacterium]
SYKVLSKKLVIEMDFDKEYKRIKDEYNNWMQLTILELQLKKKMCIFLVLSKRTIIQRKISFKTLNRFVMCTKLVIDFSF